MSGFHWTYGWRLPHARCMTNLWITIKTERAARRALAARRRQLESELAAYSTPAEIADLMAAADRTPEADSEMLRSVLNDNLSRYYARQRLVA